MNMRHKLLCRAKSDRQRAELASIDRALDGTASPANEDDPLQQFCSRLASAVPPRNPAFEDRLGAQVVATLERQPQTAMPVGAAKDVRRARRRIAGWWKPALVASAAALGSLIVAGPVLGQIGPWHSPLKTVTVHEVTSFGPAGAVGTPPVQRRWEDVADMQRKAGFAPLFPAYVPPGCTPSERWYEPMGGTISLTYSCGLDIGEFRSGASPHVAPGSAKTITVHGQPAIFIEGAWVGHAGGPLTWQDNGLGVIFFEDHGLVIQVSWHRPQEILTKVADSIP